MNYFFYIFALFNLVCSEYDVGIGIGDVSGPVAGVNMMGYANPSQTNHGIHMRLFSRAFIFREQNTDNVFVFVNVDAGMISQAVKNKVSSVMSAYSNNRYNAQNIMLTATHSHSGPAGFHAYLLFDITSLGFVNQSYVSFVDGITKSIMQADKNLQPAKLLINSGKLKATNINRSPTSYLVNPKEEIEKYSDGDTDKEMTVLKIVSDSNPETELGMISWFPVHGTSMNNTNRYCSGDNKGYAEQLFERVKNPAWTQPGKGKFVAAFGQTNEGDVSPNTNGPKCIDTGKDCDILHSSCGNRTKYCIAFGPGKDMFDSTHIIGTQQFQKALELYETASIRLSGAVRSRHQFVDMTNQVVTYPDREGTFRTCKPAMGYSFAAGTTDGPGMFDFTQGEVVDNPFWNFVRNLVNRDPSPEQVSCHHPKPILLNTGETTRPYAWQPSIVETQIAVIGPLVIVALPGEFTTMAGRRIRAAVLKSIKEWNPSAEPYIVIAGLSNTYSDYISTYEEYLVQRYESASTIYGPHTLQAYIQQYSSLTDALLQDKTIPPGPPAPEFIDETFSFLPPVVFDLPYSGNFGDVLIQPKTLYSKGDLVEVRFVGAHPRNNMRLGQSFLYVQYFNVTHNEWQTHYTDAHWETKFKWSRPSKIYDVLGKSVVDIFWETSVNDDSGTYRIVYIGDYKHIITEALHAFNGTSQSFQLID